MILDALKRLAVALAVGVSILAAIGMAGIPAEAAFPGGNGKIAFNGFPADNYDVFVVDLDGTGETRLTRTELDRCNPGTEFEGGNYLGPAWSPDGRWLAIEALTELPGGRCASGMAVLRADGEELRLIVETDKFHWARPTWSADGQSILFARADGVYVAPLDSGSPRRLLECRGCANPAWSPDGSTMAFDRNGEILLADANGANVRSVATGSAFGYPSWSPDSALIAFEAGDGRLGIVAADGTGARFSSADMDARQPAWSPDGTRLAFAAWFQGIPSVWTVRVDSFEDITSARHIVDRAFFPAWQPVPPVDLPVGMVDPATGRWHLARADGSVAQFYYGNPGDYPLMGDWDCDGVDTPGLYRRADGYAYLRNSNTQGIADVRFFFGDPGDLPLAGDFDGDGCDTVSIYRPSLGQVFVINELGSGDAGLGAADFAYYFGDPGDKPFVGDFDGDGVDTVGLHRESTGLVYFRNSHTQGIADASFVFGDPGDRLTCGDWNEDGRTSPALFRPADATWYFRFTNTHGIADATLGWGESHWLPVAGAFGLG